MIKPSSPTQNHNKIHKLSFFDQLTPMIYVPILFFYLHPHPNHPNNSITNILKKSLSLALTKYYPLAGRIIMDSLTVDCNDEGVVFLQARMSSELSEVLEHPVDETLKLLFPDGLCYKDTTLSSPLTIQVTEFDCGGMALAICVSHKILDMSSICSFVNKWASLASNSERDVTNPEFKFADLYPPIDLPVTKSVSFSKVKCVCKRFVFNGSNVVKLKRIAEQRIENPTRVEVVSALLHSCVISASSTTATRIELHQAVNLRSRVVPPLPTCYIGNMASTFVTLPPQNNEDQEYKELVVFIEGIREAKNSYFKSCAAKCGGKEVRSFVIDTTKGFREEGEEEEKVDLLACTSWCGFPFYEPDFGWGKPVWVTPSACEVKGLITMMDTRNGDGVEAYVCLEEQEMDAFIADEKLMSFCRINPNVG
ncbi:Stemmadenine O-acetyltransferase [Linum perenne]